MTIKDLVETAQAAVPGGIIGFFNASQTEGIWSVTVLGRDNNIYVVSTERKGWATEPVNLGSFHGDPKSVLEV